MKDYTNGIIYLMRGDSFTTPISINIGTKLQPVIYTLREKDAVYFGLMQPNQAFEDAVVKKKYTMVDQDEKGNIQLDLLPNDTVNLLVGKYFYMVKLRYYDDNDVERVKTIIPPTQFYIEGNNVFVGNEYYNHGKYVV